MKNLFYKARAVVFVFGLMAIGPNPANGQFIGLEGAYLFKTGDFNEVFNNPIGVKVTYMDAGEFSGITLGIYPMKPRLDTFWVYQGSPDSASFVYSNTVLIDLQIFLKYAIGDGNLRPYIGGGFGLSFCDYTTYEKSMVQNSSIDRELIVGTATAMTGLRYRVGELWWVNTTFTYSLGLNQYLSGERWGTVSIGMLYEFW